MKSISQNNRRQSQPVVCVVAPNQDAYSQTFIRAHKEYLPARIKSLYANDYENLSDDHGPLVSPKIMARLTRGLQRRFLDLKPQYFQQKELRRFLAQNGVQAVLAEFGPTATLVMDVCRKMQIPLIAHFHGFDAYRCDVLETYGRRYKELFTSATAVIAVSRDMQAQLLSLGAPADKVHYNSCGVELLLFEGADPLHSQPTFVAVGRFVNKKAPHLTLLAFKQLVEKVPEARLVMIGDGPLWEACFQMIRVLELSGVVELLGPRPHSEVALIMKQARAFVQHSITTQDGDSEGTPVAVLEAGASGLPVVATRHAGIKDAVIHTETGFLVDEGDISEMAEYMARLAQEAQLAADLGNAAREWIRSAYSMEKSINRLWSIIENSMINSS